MNQLVAAGLWLPIFFLIVLVGTGLFAYLLGYFEPTP
jgi:hypothetical protein